MILSTFKVPSAWLPIAMSMAALALVAGQLLVAGIPRDTDEGTAAHLWQLLMAGQIPLIAWFAFRWLPKGPRQAIPVLAVQLAAVVAAAAPVAWLGL
jgi:hypothetical protein